MVVLAADEKGVVVQMQQWQWQCHGQQYSSSSCTMLVAATVQKGDASETEQHAIGHCC